MWIGSLYTPMIVVKGIAFKEVVRDPVITYNHNCMGAKPVNVHGPIYIPGKIVGNQSFVKSCDLPVTCYYYYALYPVLIFDMRDFVDLRYTDGGRRPVQGYPEIEIRRVCMG